MPEGARDRVCPYPHAEDDGVTPCVFGPTCKAGHASRALPADPKEHAAFWAKFNAGGTRIGKSPAERDARLLRSQLEPWPTAVLRQRLHDEFGGAIEGLGRAEIMQGLLDGYARGGRYARRTVRVNGTPVRAELIAALRAELQAWATQHIQNDRPSIKAENYTILRAPAEFQKADSNQARKAAAKIRQYRGLWDLAVTALTEADPAFVPSFSALAVTRNFTGSPHIDNQNTGPFYGLSIGDFPEGQGGVCVECDAFTVAHVNTRHRMGKVDGRYPHWVAPYDAGCERYSLIFYQTAGSYQAPTAAVFQPFVAEDCVGLARIA